MAQEISAMKRDFFWRPLTCGLTAWGFFKMIMGSSLLLYLILSLFDMIPSLVQYEETSFMYDAVVLSGILCTLFLDCILHTILIAGSYKKSVKFLRMYYLYNAILLIMTFVLGVMCLGVIIINRWGSLTTILTVLIVADVSTFFVYLLIQIHVLLIVRGQLAELKDTGVSKLVIDTVEIHEITFKTVDV